MMDEVTTPMSNAEFLVAMHEARELEQQHGYHHPLTAQAFKRACLVIPDWMVDELPPAEQREIRFVQACHQLEQTTALHGKDSLEAGTALMLCMKYAPDEMRQAMYTTMEELIQLPAPSACGDEGNPLYSLQDVAQVLGVSDEEAQEGLDRMLAAHDAAGLDTRSKIITDPVKVHRLQ